MKLLMKKAENSVPKFNDLREVMDYKRDFAIFFSGVEVKEYFEGCYNVGVRNFLMSYHHLKGRPIKQFLSRFNGVKLFIDSGAYSFATNAQFDGYTVNQWEEYLKGYLKWAENNKDILFAIASLDIEFLVGAEQVKEWNKKYFEPFMLRTGIPVCFVWHEEETYNTWEQHCQRYPYVGLTAVNTQSAEIGGIDYFKDKLRIAEKYGAVVHGMGMTQTTALTQLPFYTVDSTTWNVGIKYGEISIWNNNKMSRIKKKDFELKAFPIIQGYNYHFDLDDIRNEVIDVMIMVNAYAFCLAEKFILHKLKKLMYWQKSKTIKNSLDSLPPDFFPTYEWLKSADTESEEIKEYARKMNINPDLGEDTYLSVCDMTLFLNWDNPDYQEMGEDLRNNPEVLQQAHDVYINKIRETDEERIQDLIQFFTDCLEGRNEFLLQMGTNFDRRQLERDEYLDDSNDDVEVEEVPESEVIKAFHNLLPTPEDATEGSEIPSFDRLSDEEYQEIGITPVRDDNGNVLRYEKRRTRKTIYSKKFPKFACDNCFVGAKCPEYKAGYVCAYAKIFKKFDTRNMVDVIQAVQSITGYDMERLQKAMIFEQLNGGIDGNVSTMIETNLRHLLLLKDLYSSANTEVLRQTKTVRADGSVESVTQVSNPQEGGILSKLLSGIAQTDKIVNEEINVTPKEEEKS